MQIINLDLSVKGIIPLLQAKQGDVGRKFRAVITDGGTAYEIPTGTTLSVWYSGTSGEGNYSEIGLDDEFLRSRSAFTISGNTVTVELVAQMLSCPGGGTMCLVMNSAEGDQIATWNIPYIVEKIPGANSEGAKQYYTAFSSAAEKLSSVETLLKSQQLKPEFANSVKECTDTSKMYVLPDGFIYACMQGESAYPAIEIEEGQHCCWNELDQRIDFSDSVGISAKRTNFIPVTPGDVLSYRGHADESIHSVVWFNSSQTRVTSEQIDAQNTAIEFTVPAGVSYAKFYSYKYVDSVDNVTLEVAWVLCQAAREPTWQNTGHAFVPADYEDRIIALENTAATNDETVVDHEERIASTEKKVADFEGQNLNSRVTKAEQSIIDLSANAVIVDKPVVFEWDNTGVYAQGSVGNAVGFTEVGDDGYGYVIIPVTPGQIYSVSAKHAWNQFAYAITDENSIILSMDDATPGSVTDVVAEVTIPSGAGYLYVSKYGFKSLTIKTAVSTAINDILYDKKIVYDGDSICYGAGYVGGYAKIIASRTYGKYVNQAVGGGYLRSASTLGKTNHSVVDNLANLPADGDLYCFEGGINDYWDNAALGTYTLNDFAGELDATTICGALETIFRYALNNFPGRPVCFVITHKIQGTAYGNNGSGNTFKEYRDSMVAICEKYSIPYYDAFSESGLNGWNSVQDGLFLTGNADNNPDGCHPNEEGYKRYYVPQLMALFRRIMPVE